MFHINGTVGGGGGGEFHGLDSGGCFAVFFVELMGGGACAKDSLDFRLGEERGNVVWHNVFDACVACSDDGAAVENVPKCNVVLQKHRFFFVDGRGEWLVQDAGENFPKAVLRVPVIKPLFARFGRGDGTQQKNFRIIIEKSRELVCYPSPRILCRFGLRLLCCHAARKLERFCQ